MNRRRFLGGLAATAAATPLARSAGAAPDASALIDTNVWLGHWPTRRAWAETPAQLAAKLRAHGVTAAWLGSFDAALHTDIAAVNARLAAACAREPLFVGFGAINPTLPDWEDDVRRCAEVHRMPGLRLLPGYHGYGLDDPRFARLLELAAARRLLVQIAVTMEDDRSQNPALTAAPVNLTPLPGVLEKTPGARVMLLNATSRLFATGAPLLQKLSHAGVSVEIATLETVAGIETLLARAPTARVCFGSHAPYFCFEAALLKLQESALTPGQLAAVRHSHARAALAPA